jgi:hypothetical protein
MDSAFVEDIVVIFDPFLRSPLYFALLFSPEIRSGDEFGSDCILSHAVRSLHGMSRLQEFCCKRPRNHGAADKRDELAAFHC